MYDNPTILNLHLRLWDSYMNNQMSGQSNFAYAVNCVIRALEGRRLAAVTHLALARRQNRRKRHFGYNKRKSLVVQKIIYKRRFIYRRSFWCTNESLGTKENSKDTKD